MTPKMTVTTIHPLGYERKPHGHHPDLFKELELHLKRLGHWVVPNDQIEHVNVLVFNSGIWAISDDTGKKEDVGKYSPYNWDILNYALAKHIPVVFFDNFDYWGTPTYGCTWCGKNDWHDMTKIQDQDYARFMYAASRPGVCRILYFMRKMQATGQTYPDWVHPLEYPLFDDFPLVSKEELFARPYDVCLLANISWQRLTAAIDLYRDGRLKVDAQIIHKRLPHHEWVNRHRQAKLFIEADASMGSERPHRLMTVAPMLRVRSDHRIQFPRQDLVHQVEVGEHESGNISREDVDKILSVVRNPDLLYSIYVNGAEHMRKHYSIEAYCTYAREKIEQFSQL